MNVVKNEVVGLKGGKRNRVTGIRVTRKRIFAGVFGYPIRIRVYLGFYSFCMERGRLVFYSQVIPSLF